MHIDITDFPSDPNGVTGNLRKELMKALRKADTYPNNIGIIRDQFAFATKKLNDITKAHGADTKAQKASSKGDN